ncbi:MAG: hypothetical protein VYD19_09355 [Myxococcota bacterium]|nr:hypothetical protein [Myxococcota bacterium]
MIFQPGPAIIHHHSPTVVVHSDDDRDIYEDEEGYIYDEGDLVEDDFIEGDFIDDAPLTADGGADFVDEDAATRSSRPRRRLESYDERVRRRCRRANRGLFGVGFGVSQAQGEQAGSSTSLSMGYRAGPVGLQAGLQFAEGELQARVESVESQLRFYIDLDSCVELFPLIGAGRYESILGESSGIASYGLGVELHLGRVLSLGAQFSQSMLFTPLQSAGPEGGELRFRDLFMIQTTLYF